MHPKPQPETAATVGATEQLVSGSLLLQPSADLLHATVVVQLIDTTLIDVAGTTLGLQQYCVTGWRVSALPFRFRVPAVPPRRRFSISAEVRRGHSSLARGDYVSMSSVAWTPNAIEGVCVPVHRI